MTRSPTPLGPWRGVLLSGLVFPGLGQFRSGHPWRALVFGSSSAVLLAAVARRVMAETQRLMPEDPAAILDPALPFRLAMEIHRDNATFFFWATLWIVAIWVASMVDAWVTGRSPRP